jgi:hypothetical protein
MQEKIRKQQIERKSVEDFKKLRKKRNHYCFLIDIRSLHNMGSDFLERLVLSY